MPANSRLHALRPLRGPWGQLLITYLAQHSAYTSSQKNFAKSMQLLFFKRLSFLFYGVVTWSENQEYVTIRVSNRGKSFLIYTLMIPFSLSTYSLKKDSRSEMTMVI